MPSSRLLFVYNAENGVFNALLDSAHKVFSPATYECSLCKYTHGLTGMLLPWKRFLDSLPQGKEFLHRTEFRQVYPGDDTPLPAIFLIEGEQRRLLLSADGIKAADGTDGLMEKVRERLGTVGEHGLNR